MWCHYMPQRIFLKLKFGWHNRMQKKPQKEYLLLANFQDGMLELKYTTPLKPSILRGYIWD